MLVLAFDTSTRTATSALVRDGTLLGERSGSPVALLEAVDALLREAGAEPGELDGLAVGVGPGSFTGLRMGLATARALAFALEIGVAGVSTLAALAAGAPGAVPVLDGGRREIFTHGSAGEPVCIFPAQLRPASGAVCVGDGALRYRALLEKAGAVVPPEGADEHRIRARFHAGLAGSFGAAELVEPLYLRVPDADRVLA